MWRSGHLKKWICKLTAAVVLFNIHVFDVAHRKKSSSLLMKDPLKY